MIFTVVQPREYISVKTWWRCWKQLGVWVQSGWTTARRNLWYYRPWSRWQWQSGGKWHINVMVFCNVIPQNLINMFHHSRNMLSASSLKIEAAGSSGIVVSVYKNSVMLIFKITVTLGFPTYSPWATCGLPGSIMCLVATFVNYV